MADTPINPGPADPIAADDTRFRFNLAKWIVIFVFSVTGVIGITAIVAAVIPTQPGFG